MIGAGVLLAIGIFSTAGLVAACFKARERSEYWACEYRNVERAQNLTLECLEKSAKELQNERAKCSECFLDHAGLRKNIEDLTADYGKLADDHGVTCQALVASERSNAALRGQITKLKGKAKL